MQGATIIATVVAMSSAGMAIAGQTFTSKNDLDKRPVKEIAAELGIEPEQFADCFAKVTPAPDFRPSGQQQRANKAVLLPCLQRANPGITNARLDEVMDRYRGRHVPAD